MLNIFVATMSSRSPNDTSEGASLGVTPSPRYDSNKFTGWEMGIVWTAPCGAPEATFIGEMVHNAGRFYGTKLIDLKFPAIGGKMHTF